MRNAVAIMAIFALLATSCTTPKTIIKEVPVYIHDTTHIVQNDSVHTTDTVIREAETIIREADSATLAALGIKLQDKERAILILRTELQRQIRENERMKSDSTYHHDEKPVQTQDTEIIEVEKALTPWQNFIMGTGYTLGAIALAVVVIRVLRKKREK